jgi:hypothetical protein
MSFKIGDKVVLKAKKGNDGYIGGIINYPTVEAMRFMFSTKVEKVKKYFGDELRGMIIEVGKHNTYLIEDPDEAHYVFMNDYNEMQIDDEDEIWY